MSATDIWMDIQAERTAAERKYGPFKSTHEGYGVLAEEAAELLEAIRANDRVAVQNEAKQVSAVAWRIAECVELLDVRRRSGMGDF